MPFELLEKVFTELFQSGRCADELSVVWHSGEPLTIPPDYYRKAIDLILKINVVFDFQTNAVLIKDDWISFFKDYADVVKLGVSCDGPAHIHDSYRLNWGGKPTFSKVLAGMELLAQNGIRFKVIAVVTEATLAAPDDFFDFFCDRKAMLSGFHFNILADGALSDDPELTYSRDDRNRYYDFYRHILRRANNVTGDKKEFSIQNFTQALSRILSNSSVDSLAEASLPIRTLNVDAHGEITTFYAGLERSAHRDLYDDGNGLGLGNINVKSLENMFQSEKLKIMLNDFQLSQTKCRQNCNYYGVCSGGFELAKVTEHKTFDATETAECSIIVKTLVDALLDDISEFGANKAADMTDQEAKV